MLSLFGVKERKNDAKEKERKEKNCDVIGNHRVGGNLLNGFLKWGVRPRVVSMSLVYIILMIHFIRLEQRDQSRKEVIG